MPKLGRPNIDLQARKKMADQRRRAEASGRADSDEVHRVGDRVSRVQPPIAAADLFVYSATVAGRPTRWSAMLRLVRSAVANARIKRRSAVSAQTPGLVARSCRRRSALLVVVPRPQYQVSATSRGPQGLPHGSSGLLQPLRARSSWSTTTATLSRLLYLRPWYLPLHRLRCRLCPSRALLHSHQALCCKRLRRLPPQSLTHQCPRVLVRRRRT